MVTWRVCSPSGGSSSGTCLLIMVVLGLIWAVGKPHAQQFIEDTVDARLDELEESTDELSRAVEELIEGQEAESVQSQFEARALGEVLCRLRAEGEAGGPEPEECRR